MATTAAMARSPADSEATTMSSTPGLASPRTTATRWAPTALNRYTGTASPNTRRMSRRASPEGVAWGLTTPEWPDKIVDTPDFGLIGQFSLFGAFSATDVGVITVILLIFTLILSDFFDTMGTVVGISAEAGLLDEQGKVPNLCRVLLIDGAAAVAGGAASSSSATSYIESAAGVGEGSRTGFSNLVTGGLFALALFLTPLLTIVPLQAAAPALVRQALGL